MMNNVCHIKNQVFGRQFLDNIETLADMMSFRTLKILMVKPKGAMIIDQVNFHEWNIELNPSETDRLILCRSFLFRKYDYTTASHEKAIKKPDSLEMTWKVNYEKEGTFVDRIYTWELCVPVHASSVGHSNGLKSRLKSSKEAHQTYSWK